MTKSSLIFSPSCTLSHTLGAVPGFECNCSWEITVNFINWESCSTICMNFIWIGSRAPENQTRLFLLFESEFFGQNIDFWPTRSSVVTMATIHLRIQIWLFLFIPPGNLPPHKNWRGVNFFHFQLCFTFSENCGSEPHVQNFLNFAKSCILSCLSKYYDKKTFHRAAFKI